VLQFSVLISIALVSAILSKEFTDQWEPDRLFPVNGSLPSVNQSLHWQLGHVTHHTLPSNQQEDWLLLLHHHYITSSRRMQAYWPPYLMNGLMHIKSIVTQSLKLRTFTDNNYSYWLGCQSSVLFTDNSFYAFPQQSPYCCSALNTQSIQLYPSVFERAVKYARWKTLYIAEIFNNVCCL